MKILLVSATVFEIAPILQYLEKNYTKKSFFEFANEKHTIFPLVTGVGMVNTAFAMARFHAIKEVDVAINLGIAGSYRQDFGLGQVYEVVKDRFGDLGVEEKDGSFTDVFALELIDKNMFPYEDGWISNKPKLDLHLPKAIGISVNKVHGNETSIKQIQVQYSADIESMEGAGFLYACKNMDVKCHQMRSISNFVEPRNKTNWKIELAIENLNTAFLKLID